MQGIDYAYTINGCLKGINMPSLQPDHDPGGDGAETQAPYSDNYTDTIPLMGYVSSRTLGAKQYELTDHLGNVRATVSDVVIKHYTNLDAELSTRTDYYPFGMIMGGRNSSVDTPHRYGFNGKENDNEVKGEGVQQDYGFRIYDARVGRFLSVDPLMKSYPSWSPYPFAMNRCIDGVDIDGREWGESTSDLGGGTKCVNRWIYAKVTRKYPENSATRGRFHLDNARMWNILTKTKEYLSQAMSTGDERDIDYSMSPNDVKFVHHVAGSSQADHNLDIVIQFESTVWVEDQGYVAGANYNRGETENGLIRIALGMMGRDNEYISFTDDQIASTIAHELVHSAGLGDANLTQPAIEDEHINQSVPMDAPNLMNQKSTGRQGPFLTPRQQSKVSQTIDENKGVRNQKQKQRSERNND